jgi:nicotinate-nucleotide pyrophosphorylase (carboxylating)
MTHQHRARAMVKRMPLPPAEEISAAVSRALAEDIGSGDLTAALVPPDSRGHARILVREAAVLCGQAWCNEVFRQIEPATAIQWHKEDGADLAKDDVVCTLSGPARGLLTAERTALNFLQTLSATATAARRFVLAVAGTGAVVLDTRKTLPGLRLAQKYAATCGGAQNHRIGLFDGILIKENHIMAAGGVGAAVRAARQVANGVLVEVEVEDLQQVHEALAAAADRLLLDNFSLEDLRAAVGARDACGQPNIKLEASGGLELEQIRAVAQCGVDLISIGAITKHVQAVDYSMRFIEASD